MPVEIRQLTKAPVVNVEMLIRRPPHEVFQALFDPAITTKFWFTKSTGKMIAGAELQWEWEMYDFSVKVWVKEVEEDSRMLFAWGNDNPTLVEFRFTPFGDDATHVQVTESELGGNADEAVAYLGDSTGGFTIVLCALKALLEHGIVLTAVGDAHPQGLEN